MGKRADRLFQLVEQLRGRRLVTAQVLADELGVSVRTIYRDISDLAASGVPIRGEAGVGYTLDKHFDLPPMTFSNVEIEALVLGARMVEGWGDAELGEAARSALTKIRARLPSPLRPRVSDTPMYAPTGPFAESRKGELTKVRGAIHARRKVCLDYEDRHGVASERTIRPLALHFWGQSWSVLAWCELREDYRAFRTDRMHNLRVLDDTFDESDGIGFAAFFEREHEEGPLPSWRGFR